MINKTQQIFRAKVASDSPIALPTELVSSLHLNDGDEVEISTDGTAITNICPVNITPSTFFPPGIVLALDQREMELEEQCEAGLRNASDLRAKLRGSVSRVNAA